MIRAKARDGTIILGLSELNLEYLRRGRPIKTDGRSFGCPGDIVILYGKTEAAIAAALGIPIAETFDEDALQ